jgi:hypothetical protein
MHGERTFENMDTIRLQQTLENFPKQDVIQYYVTSQFLKDKTYLNLMTLIQWLDFELRQDYELNPEQKACIQYLFRDWGYGHLKPKLGQQKINRIFMINDVQQTPGHLMEAIDFAKRNPKNNEKLMRFGLTLLIHSSLKESDTKHKIDALEQLLTHQDASSSTHYQHQVEQSIIWLVIFNLTLFIYCIWILTKIKPPIL